MSIAAAAAPAGFSWGLCSGGWTQVLPGHRLPGAAAGVGLRCKQLPAGDVGYKMGLWPCPLCQPGQEASPWLLLGGFLLHHHRTASAGWAEGHQAGQRAVSLRLCPPLSHHQVRVKYFPLLQP